MKPYIPTGSDTSEVMLKMLENREIWRKGSESFYTWLVHIYTYNPDLRCSHILINTSLHISYILIYIHRIRHEKMFWSQSCP